MDWIEVRVTTTSAGTEAVFGVLLSCGINGAQIIDDRDMQCFLHAHPYTWDYIDEKLIAVPNENAYVVFYVSPDPAGREILAHVKDRLRGLRGLVQADVPFPLGSLAVDEASVNDDMWLHEWKNYYKPFKLGRSVVIKPEWEPYVALPGEVVFTIEPGAVFGTGLHPSTQLCVEALEDCIAPGDGILDIGCGSGILSIIALLLGAGSALACDYEPAAAVNAADNARLNGFDTTRYTVCTGDIFTDNTLKLLIAQQQYEVVVANIVAEVVMNLALPVRDYLKPGGVFIASGIITERVSAVCDTLAQAGLSIRSVLERDGWNCLICQNIF